MSENNEAYRNPGDVEIASAHFVTQTGNVIDISGLIDTLNIYQNIFRHYLECDVLIHDASKFLHNLPYFPDEKFTGGFSGTERFVVSYHNREKNPKVYTHSFRLHSIKDRISANNSEIYSFMGISEEAYYTHALRLSQSFGGDSGAKTEDMVKGIHKNHFKSAEILEHYRALRDITHNRINKNLETHPSIGKHKFVMPNLLVDDAIRFLCRESDCASRIPLFYFWEDSENFNFKNVNGLVNQEPVDEYFYTRANVNTPDPIDKNLVQDSKTIIGYRVNRQFDLLENVDAGLYRARTTKLDVLKKKYKEVVYNYSDYSKIFNKLQSKIISGSVGTESVQTVITSRNGHDSDPVFAAEAPKVKRIDGIKDIRNSFKKSVFNTSMEISIPANPHLKVGQTIQLNFPIDTDDQKGIDTRDKYLTGKYLITKVRQIFSASQKMTVLECTKDGGIA